MKMPILFSQVVMAAATFAMVGAFAEGAKGQASYSDHLDKPFTDVLQSEAETVNWAALVDRAVVQDVYVHPQSAKVAIAELRSKPSRQHWSGPSFRINLPRGTQFDVSALNFDPQLEVGWAHQVKIRDIGSGTERTLEIPVGAVVGEIAWSPNGNWLSYVLRKDGAVYLWIASVESGESRQVSERPINLLVDGQVSNSLRMPFYKRHVPYTWLPDERGIVFAAKDLTVRFSQEEWSFVDAQRSITSSDEKYSLPSKQYSVDQMGALRRIKLSKAYSQELVYAPVRKSKRETSVNLRHGITQILARNTGSQITTVTLDVGDRGEYLRRAQVISFGRAVPGMSDPVHISKDLRWELYTSSSDDFVTIAQLSNENRYCFIGILAAASDENPRVCFENPIIDVAEDSATLTVLTSVNSVFEVSKQDLSIAKNLQLSASGFGGVRLLRRPGGTCAAASKPIVSIEGSERDEIPNLPVSGMERGRGYTILRLDFDRKLAIPIGDIVGERVRVLPTGYSMCDGAPILSQESFGSPKNYLIRHSGSSSDVQLTRFQDLMPELGEWKRIELSYQRNDGISLTADVVLPPTRKRMVDGTYPAIIWQYPRQVKSVSEWGNTASRSIEHSLDVGDAGRFRYRRHKGGAADGAWNQYHRPISENYIGNWLPLMLAYDGYAVISYPDMPLIGDDGNQKYGTFSKQLRLNAEALVKAVSEVGVIDEMRLAIGGHSRGGTVAAQLLAETDLFAAGFGYAGPSSFNSQLFGFQFEERTFWEYPDAYIRNSPIFGVDRINEPLLSMYGDMDGFPTREQGEDLHRVLTHMGKISKLVIFPDEKHVPQYWETQLSILEEVSGWLNAHMENQNSSSYVGSP